MGVLVAVYAGPQFQKGAEYFKAHMVLMMAAIVMNIVGITLSLSSALGTVDTVHGVFGLVVFIVCMLQPINAFLRPSKDHKHRRVWEILHKGSGRLCALFGLITCILGAVRFDKNYGYLELVLTLVIVPLVFVVVLWICLRLKQME